MKKDSQKGRKAPEKLAIDQDLVSEGISQLSSEIKVLETWLKELEKSGHGDQDSAAAKKSYRDMLRSRKEMLSALSAHAGKPGLSSRH
jgi:hypothetical protein